jgi:hypothetical protein
MVARSPTLSLCVAVYYKLARPRFASRDGALPAVKVKVRSRVTDLSTGTDPHRHTAQPKRQVATVLVHGNQFFESDGPIPRLCFDCMNYPLTKAGTRKCCAPDKQASRLTELTRTHVVSDHQRPTTTRTRANDSECTLQPSKRVKNRTCLGPAHERKSSPLHDQRIWLCPVWTQSHTPSCMARCSSRSC